MPSMVVRGWLAIDKRLVMIVAKTNEPMNTTPKPYTCATDFSDDGKKARAGVLRSTTKLRTANRVLSSTLTPQRLRCLSLSSTSHKMLFDRGLKKWILLYVLYDLFISYNSYLKNISETAWIIVVNSHFSKKL